MSAEKPARERSQHAAACTSPKEKVRRFVLGVVWELLAIDVTHGVIDLTGVVGGQYILLLMR